MESDMKRFFPIAVFSALLCVSALPILTSGQQGTSSPRERIYFSALNKEEKPVLDLKPTDFELRVNGKPALIEEFEAGLPVNDRSIPIAVLVLMGINPRTKSDVIKSQADAAAGLFQMVHPSSVMGVKLVSDRSETLAPLAHDPGAVRNAFIQYEQRRSELDAGLKKGIEVVGVAGMTRAAELAIDEIQSYVENQPALRSREIHKAVMLISEADINPKYSLKPLYAKASERNVFLYPVYYPIGLYAPIIEHFFELAKKTAGLAAFFGALKPGSQTWPVPRSDLKANALNVNFIHMVRDLNGKYSFTMPSPGAGQKLRIELKCKVKNVKIRLPRTEINN
jgi:hypothetical protein